MGLTIPLPVYVTRKTATGESASYSLSAWQTLLAFALVWANVVAWAIIGLAEAVRLAVGQL